MSSKKVDKREACRLLQTCNSGSKTAISKVMELATRLGIEVEFEETTEISWTKDCFKFNAKLGDIRAVAGGRSKKEAKQNSAQELLNVIEEYDSNSVSSSASVTPVKYNSLSPSESSPSDSCSNAIGELQNLSAKKKWKLPEYEISESGGEPHCKTFTCLVKMMSDLECQGTGLTKKAAKKHAAEKMLNILQGDGMDIADAKEYTSASPFNNQVSSPNSSLLDSSDLEDYYSSSSDSPSSNMDNSNEVEDIIIDEQSLTQLISKSTIEKFKHEFIYLPNKSKSKLHQVFLKLTFTENHERPPVVTQGSGETERIAELKAAHRGLKHLEVILALP